MSPKRIALLSAGLGGLTVLAVAAWLFSAALDARKAEVGGRKAPAEASSGERRPLPPYRMANLDQQEIQADELRRGRVLLVYLTTGCDPCVKEVEVVSRLQRDAPPDLRVYGVAIERPAQVATFVKEFDLKFPILIDMGSEMARALDIHHFPSMYLVEDGIITKVWRGATRDEAELRRQLGMK
jgi:peroxiredoxin